MKKIFVSDYPEFIERVYSENVKNALACQRQIYSRKEILESPEKFTETEYIFSTWGMPVFTVEEVKKCFPTVKCLFYAAGSVKEFAEAFMANDIRIFSAWAANAIPVAEYAMAQILLANKGFYMQSHLRSRGEIEKSEALRWVYQGNYDIKVGIIGAGMIGKKLIELLKPFQLEILVFDPFLSEKCAKELGVQKTTLEDLFAQCEVISNHLADNEQTKGILHYELFSRMKPYATFINTGRGAQVVEADLAKVLAERKDIYAVLDVTYPEPCEENHPFYRLENCILTPHIAGSLGNESRRMADFMLKEYETYIAGGNCKYEISPKMLEMMT